MREFKILTLVLLGVTLLGTVAANRKTSSQEQRSEKLESSEKETEAALEVVRKYISLSHEGKFDEIALITVAIPKDAQRKTSPDPAASTKSELPPGTITVVGPSPLLSRLDSIRKDFPESFRQNKQQIVNIGELTIGDSLVKVPVYLGNEDSHSLLPWVFMMVKQNGAWKIYNINTPAYAADYYP